MTIPKIYGAFIRKLPVSSKSKNWLMRNWKGALIGVGIGLWPFISMLFIGYIEPNGFEDFLVVTNMVIIPGNLLWFLLIAPIFRWVGFGWAGTRGFISATFWDVSEPNFIASIICSIIIFSLSGAFIQSLLRGRK